jgi:CubicO group peptidase (beta-lactamase class C family)
MKLIYTLALILFTQQSFSQSIPKELKGLDKKINELMSQHEAVGLAVAVVKNNKVIYSKGFGYRNLDKKLPVNENTIFHIASMSKAFTGSLLGILEGENKLSLKDKPAEHIPNFQFYNDEMNKLITIEDLLSHKSGIGSHGSSIVMFPEKDKLKTVQRLKYLKPQAEIKSSWVYSNIGYTLAGTIVEQVTGSSWESNIREKLLVPLDMKATFTSIEAMEKTSNFSLGYARYKGNTEQTAFENYYSISPAGAIKSSVSDLSNWMYLWLNKGSFKGKQVIPQSYIRAASRLQNIKHKDEYEEGSFLWGEGFGWRLRAWEGHYRIRHGGNTNGFSTAMDLFPLDNIGIVVLTNQKNSLLPYSVSDYISRKLLGLPEFEFPVIVNDTFKPDLEDKPLNKEKPPTHSLQAFTGVYQANGYGKVQVVLEEGKLYGLLPNYKFKLEHLNYNTFYFKPLKGFKEDFNPGFPVKFIDDIYGEITKFEFHALKQPVEFKKGK